MNTRLMRSAAACSISGLVMISVLVAGAQPAAAQVDQPGLGRAFANTRDAGSYRFDMSMSARGLPGLSLFGGSVRMLDATGEVSGKDSRLSASGMLFSLLGAGKAMDVVTVDGSTYVKGGPAVKGTSVNGWTRTRAPELLENPVGKLIDPDNELALTPEDFTPIRSETIGGQACETYIGYAGTFEKALSLIGVDALGPQAGLDFKSGTIQLTACEDGFVHRATIDAKVLARQQGNLTLDVSMAINAHDFGSAVAVDAPNAM